MRHENILEIAGRHERITYFPPYDVSPLLSLPLYQNYRIACGVPANGSKPIPAIPLQRVQCPIQTASDDTLCSMYQSLQTTSLTALSDWQQQDIFHPFWFPIWTLSSYNPPEVPIPISQFALYWKQYVSSLTPGEGLHQTSCFVDLPESDDTKQLFHSLLSYVQSVIVHDRLTDEPSLQTLLNSFNVFQWTENRESQVGND